MTAEPSNASTERILSLLLLLTAGEHTREDILTRIAAYHRDGSLQSQRRMLDRDLATMERAGICVTHKDGRYWVSLSQFEHQVRILNGEHMHPTALDRGLMLWVPRV
jgi:hypothetical protein